MAIEVRGINELNLFKIGMLNFRGKSKEWFKNLITTPTIWQTMKATMLLKYDITDKEEIRAKLHLIKQEPKQQVQTYYDQMEKLFAKNELEDAEHVRDFCLA